MSVHTFEEVFSSILNENEKLVDDFSTEVDFINKNVMHKHMKLKSL